MYWGDSSHDKIEMAYINGTGRRTLLSEQRARYVDIQVHEGNIYITDQKKQYAFLPSFTLSGYTGL